MKAGDYRVARQAGSDQWLVKRAPFWKVVHRGDTLLGAADWLAGQGIAAADVMVVHKWPWRPLSDVLAEQRT